ncbi:hypothetical protein AB3N59_20455 (plasmid) [Leptospira sp. WS92.C1]
MDRDKVVGQVALEAKLAYKTFRIRHGHEPNEREKVGILRNHGFTNAFRIVKHLEFLEKRIEKLADEILEGEGV